ncbi:MAG TPA: hypothetical protein VJR22_08310 [Candidatus Nitrosotalea sp.]|nr:hypothetical protein [Candidatus Nitrosotalea sp.]
MAEDAPSWLIEKHISEFALPNEEFLSWLKWEPKMEFETIVIKSQPDVIFNHILNVDEKVFQQEGIKNGKIIIEKNMLQIDGFVGFSCFYNVIPETEIDLSFVVDFLQNGIKLSSIDLNTKIVRPLVAIDTVSEQEIRITQQNPIVPPLKFGLKNLSKARISTIVPFLEFVQGKDLSITTEQKMEKNNDTSLLFVPTTMVMRQKILVRGKGIGMITIGYEYVDNVGNKYKTKVISIPIELQQKERVEIPINQEIEGQNNLMQLQPIIN